MPMVSLAFLFFIAAVGARKAIVRCVSPFQDQHAEPSCSGL